MLLRTRRAVHRFAGSGRNYAVSEPDANGISQHVTSPLIEPVPTRKNEQAQNSSGFRSGSFEYQVRCRSKTIPQNAEPRPRKLMFDAVGMNVMYDALRWARLGRFPRYSWRLLPREPDPLEPRQKALGSGANNMTTVSANVSPIR